MIFSERLRMLREKGGYTQQQLADILRITKNSISHYELNMCMPSIEVLVEMTRFFNVSMDYLLCLSDYNLSIKLLEKPISNKKTVGSILESILNLDRSHQADLLKILYYIEKDNFSSRIRAHPYSGWGNGYNDSTI